jgi:hypothetical protein
MELHLTKKCKRFQPTLSAQMQKANELDEAIKQNLAKIGYAL